MKYICLGYFDESRWDALSQGEREAMMRECIAYDVILREKGHFLGGESLQSVRNAATLRWQNGRTLVTDGPFAETKEQLGGLMVLEAEDLNHAIQLMSEHPGIRLGGSFEIRATDEMGCAAKLNEPQAISSGRSV